MGGAFGNVNHKKIFISRDKEDLDKRLGEVYNVYKKPHDIGTYMKTFKSAKLGQFGTTYDVRSLKKACSQKQLNTICDELKVLCKINHPNILKYHAVFEDKQNLYVVIEPNKDQSLAYLLDTEGNTYSEFKAAFVIYQLVKAVKFLHSNGIAHRNIRPENIVINEHGFIKLIDLEISKTHIDDMNFKKKASFSEYTAPEIQRTGKYGKSNDIWAIGILTYFLLTESFPFGGDRLVDSFKSSANCILTFKSSSWKEFSPDVVDFIKSMLSGDPDKRISAEDLVKHPWFDILREGSVKPSRESSRQLSQSTVADKSEMGTEMRSKKSNSLRVQEPSISIIKAPSAESTDTRERE